VPFFGAASGGRDVARKAAAFARLAAAEPEPAHVQWVAATATKGDDDHAAWELRYARRALAVLVAQRDALDDRTGAAVAHEVAGGFAADPAVDPSMLDVAVQQFNARLSAYRDVLHARAGASLAVRLGQMLLAFAGGPIGRDQSQVAEAGQIMTAYLAESSEALQATFGSPVLPDDVPPSALGRR